MSHSYLCPLGPRFLNISLLTLPGPGALCNLLFLKVAVKVLVSASLLGKLRFSFAILIPSRAIDMWVFMLALETPAKKIVQCLCPKCSDQVLIPLRNPCVRMLLGNRSPEAESCWTSHIFREVCYHDETPFLPTLSVHFDAQATTHWAWRPGLNEPRSSGLETTNGRWSSLVAVKDVCSVSRGPCYESE